MPPSPSSALRPFRWLSPAGRGARLSIFIFHRVLPQPDPLLPDEPDAVLFDRQVAFIARNFRVLPLADAARALGAGRLPAAAACITFDDGYADNLDVAAPILARHGATATFFIATAFIGGGRMWNDTVIESVCRAPAGRFDLADVGLESPLLDGAASRVDAYQALLLRLKYLPPAQRADAVAEIGRRSGLPARSDLMMTPEQLRSLRGLGMDVGGHTATHPILKVLSDDQARDEIAAGRDALAGWLGEAPRAFAYPNGVPGVDYGERDVALVRQAGFECAVSTARGAARVETDPMQLPRFTPWDRSMGRFGLRCAQTLLMRDAA